jgi:hypothetical protein
LEDKLRNVKLAEKYISIPILPYYGLIVAYIINFIGVYYLTKHIQDMELLVIFGLILFGFSIIVGVIVNCWTLILYRYYCGDSIFKAFFNFIGGRI